MPSVRSSQLKEDVLALASLGEDVRAGVMRRLSPETLRQIADASRVEWLPHHLLLELVHAIREVAGEEALRGWGFATVKGTMQATLYRPFLEGLVAVFGLSPTAAWKVLPRAYAAAFKDCGEIRLLESGPGAARMVLADLPLEAKDRDWLLTVAGAFELVFDFCKVKGRVELQMANPSADPHFYATWK